MNGWNGCGEDNKKRCFVVQYEINDYLCIVNSNKLKRNGMTQLVVTIAEPSSVSMIKKAISLIKGVVSVSVRKQNDVIKKKNVSVALPPEMQELVGIVSFTEEEIKRDERLAYILSK